MRHLYPLQPGLTFLPHQLLHPNLSRWSTFAVIVICQKYMQHFQIQELLNIMIIEEPEAHVHAQRQLKLIQSLEEGAETNRQQITNESFFKSILSFKTLPIPLSVPLVPTPETKASTLNRNFKWRKLYRLCFIKQKRCHSLCR